MGFVCTYQWCTSAWLRGSVCPKSEGGSMKSDTIVYRFLATGFLLLCFAFAALAQEATIVGTVTDPSGAPVPNVNITLTNTETALVRHLTSNNVGQYVLPDVHIGHYVARAEAPGFKTAEQRDIVL